MAITKVGISPQIIKKNIKLYRKKMNFSQSQLAEKIDKTSSFLAELEIGRKMPSIETLFDLAKALDIEPYKLLKDPETRENDIIDSFANEVKMELSKSIEEIKKRY